MAQEVIRNDLSRVFEYNGVWRDQINRGTTPGVPTGLAFLAATFFNITPPNAPSGETPPAVLGLMTSYMSGYSAWAAMGFTTNIPGSYTNGNFAPYNEISGALRSSGVVP